MKPAILLYVVSCLAISDPALAQDHAHQAGGLGSVHFTTSCTALAQPTFDRAVALLHSFEFGEAIAAFEATAQADPACAMTQWGIAVARWSNPFAVGTRSPQQLQQGRDAVERARAIGARTERERGYIDAIAHLYTDASRPQSARVEAYRDAMADVSRRHPDDTEAAIFYALSLTAAEDLNDKSYASRLQAVGVLEPLFKRQPDHPGLAHYIIHSYDVPALAPRALDAAARYAQIAPAAPHALHMPSHTYTRVGHWQPSIDTNVASAREARKQGAVGEELHASDYQMYAYLQTAQDAAAQQLLDTLPEMIKRYDPKSAAGAAPPAAAYFAMAAMPARYALERGAWAEAASLPLRPSPLPYVDALTEFARAIGTARAGDPARAREAMGRLEALRVKQTQMNEPYWTQQIEIQLQSAAAWLAFAEGRTAAAVSQMRAVADAEDRTDKSALTPGPLAPARELLGEMLLASKDPSAALKAFEATLAKEPNRFRALAGAIAATTQSGDTAAAKRYRSALVAQCPRAAPPLRPELASARAAIGR